MRNKHATRVMAVLLSAILVLPVFPQSANAVTLSQQDTLSGNSMPEDDSVPEVGTGEPDEVKDHVNPEEPNQDNPEEPDQDNPEISDQNRGDLESYFCLDYESMNAEEFEEIISSTSSEELWTILFHMSDQAREHILSLDTGLKCPAMTYDYECTPDSSDSETDICNTRLKRSWDTSYEYLKSTYGSGTDKVDTLKKKGYFTIVFQDTGNSVEPYKYSKVSLETDDTNLNKSQTIKYKITITYAREGLCLNDEDGYRRTHTNKEIMDGTANDCYAYMNLPFVFNKRCGYTYTSTTLNRKGSTLCCFKNNSKYTNGTAYSNMNGSDISRQTVNLFINVLSNTTLGGADGQDGKPAIVMQPVSYHVVYDTNGATSGTASAQKCVFDETYAMPCGMKRNVTVRFNTNGGNPIADQMVETAFAYWKLNTPAGEAYAQGQAFTNLTSDEGTVVSAKAEWYPGHIILPCVNRTGYDFAGWDAGTCGQNIQVTASCTLSANWNPHTYKVQFVSDGVVRGTQNMVYGKPTNLTRLNELGIQKPGYRFKGWNSLYADGQTVHNLTAGNADVVTLVADWEASRNTKYTINRYVQKELDNTDPETGYQIYEPGNKPDNNYKDSIVQGTEIRYGTTDEIITVPATSIDGYEKPDDQMVKVNGDGSTVVNFYYNLIDNRAGLRVNHYYQIQPDGEYILYKGRIGDYVQENYSDTVNGCAGDICTPVFLGEEVLNAYKKAYPGFHLQLPEPQTVTLSKNSEVNYYYKMIEDDHGVRYQVEHWIQKEVGAKYELFETEMAFASEDAVVTPALNQKAIAEVNLVPECKCEVPQLQTLTVRNGTIVKYYYACVKAKDGNIYEGDEYYNVYGLTSDQARQLIEAIEAGSSALICIDGVTYTLEKNADGTLVIKIANVNNVGVFRVPGEVVIGEHIYTITEIYKNCFKNNKELTEVIIGSNITSIGDSAFEGCDSLKKITFENGLINIGNLSFKNCNHLISVKLPGTVQTIGKQAFMNCISLKELRLNGGLLKVGNNAFYNCKKLTAVKIPKSLLKLGSYAFGKCGKLKSLTFSTDSELLSAGTGVFSNCSSLTKVKLPSKLSTIPVKAFYQCKSIKSVSIGISVTRIGKESFLGCTKLSGITVESKVQSIGTKAFYNCKLLKLVTIKSEALTSVGKDAFKGCKKGIKFKIPGKQKSHYIKLLENKF